MLSLRLLANLFANPTGKALVCENVDEILLHLELFLETTNKGIQIALASVLLNVATSSRKDINTSYCRFSQRFSLRCIDWWTDCTICCRSFLVKLTVRLHSEL
eukprot:m.265203 g.265203  ORF g.265203 m.265203 type:complete len:103 (+) comp40484_c0_seq10:1987-2295(+)